MKKKGKLTLKSRFESFSHAIRGLTDMLTTEPNAWLHLAMTAIVLLLAWWLQIEKEPLTLIIIVIVGVWMAEAFNTVLEIVVDLVSSGEYSEAAKRAKDIAAAAVLIASIGATIIGLIVLGPPLFSRLSFLLS